MATKIKTTLPPALDSKTGKILGISQLNGCTIEWMTIPLASITPNPDNPRVIKDKEFNSLVKSIKEFPEMMHLRPIVVNENMIALGGNMRYEAHQVAGLLEVMIMKISGLTADKQREFIIKDNVAFGSWNFDELANNWDVDQLNDWGLEIPQFGGADPDEDQETCACCGQKIKQKKS